MTDTRVPCSGVAVGDALGAPLEFMTAEEIRRRYGGPVTEMIGGGWLSVEPGEVTDDTQMTLAVAEGIAETNGSTPMFQIGETGIRRTQRMSEAHALPCWKR